MTLNRRTDDTTERYTNSDASGLVVCTILTWNIACIGNCLPSKHDARINKVAENQADTNAANDRPTERSCASGELMVTVRKSYNETSYSTPCWDESPATQSCRCMPKEVQCYYLYIKKAERKPIIAAPKARDSSQKRGRWLHCFSLTGVIFSFTASGSCRLITFL